MTTPFPVDGMPDRPDFALRLNGRDAPAALAMDVLEIDVSEEVNRHGRAALLLRNWDDGRRQVLHSDGPDLVAGVEVEISLGWHDELVTVFTGVVTGLTARFGESGPTVEIACRTRSALLAAVPRARAYENVTDGDVAADLAAAYGLTASAASGISQPQLVIAGQSDWDWLVRRAGQLGWVTYVRGADLVFRPAAEPADDDLALEYGTSLRELRLTEDLAGRADPITVSGWSSADLEPVTADAGSERAEPGSDGRPTPADALAQAGWPLRANTIATPADLPADEADRRAVGAASTEVLRRLSGTGRTLGLPKLAADSWLSLTGVGDRLDGRHYVSAVRHRLGRHGYTSEFQLGHPPPLLPPHPAAEPGGLLPGLVTDLDDPLGTGRVKVAFPWLGQEPVWARLITLDAGPAQGTWFVPDVGQEVVVGHLGDDRRFPVVLGALWNGQQQPPEQMDARANAIRSIVTRSGHRLAFDDGEPGLVTLTTAGGHAFVLDDSAGTITLTEQGGTASITLGSDGVSIVADQGDITLSAPAGALKLAASRLSSKASGPATVESTASLELKATGSLSVSGAMVRIN
ncbi:phage baseplate assembly protein V [Nonomuraea endophytica]|uniref:phage baseplate assembly protein V n=1 Tax=Nonomuraea endophytica TaxID=714136 RepID=UPI0037CC4E26